MQKLFLKRNWQRGVVVALCLVLSAALVPIVMFNSAPSANAVNVGTWADFVNQLNAGVNDIYITTNISFDGNLNGGPTIGAGRNVVINCASGVTISKNYNNVAIGSWTTTNNVPGVYPDYASNFREDPSNIINRSGTTATQNPFLRINGGATVTINGGRWSMGAYRPEGGSSSSSYNIKSYGFVNDGNLTLNGVVLDVGTGQWATNNNHCLESLAIGVWNNGNLYINSCQLFVGANASGRASSGYSSGTYAQAIGIYSPNGGNTVVSHVTSRIVAYGDPDDQGGSNNLSFQRLYAWFAYLGDGGNLTISNGEIGVRAGGWCDNARFQASGSRNVLSAIAFGYKGTNYPSVHTSVTTSCTTFYHSNIGGYGRNYTGNMALAWWWTDTNVYSLSTKGNNGPGTMSISASATGWPQFTGGSWSEVRTLQYGNINNNAAHLDAYGVGQGFGSTDFRNGWLSTDSYAAGTGAYSHYYRLWSDRDMTSPGALLENSFNVPGAQMAAVMDGNINSSLGGHNGNHAFSELTAPAQFTTFNAKNPNYYRYGGTTYVKYDNYPYTNPNVAPHTPSGANATANHGLMGTYFTSLPAPESRYWTMVYVNVFKLPAKTVTFAPAVTTFTYDGSSLKGGDFAFSVNDVYQGNITSQYDLGNNNSSLIPVIYSYSSDGGSSYTPGLPTNAGNYKIKVNLNQDTVYTLTSKNQNAYQGIFDVVINKATPTIADLGTYPLMYGNKPTTLTDTCSATYTLDSGAQGNVPCTFTIDTLNPAVDCSLNAGAHAMTLRAVPSDTANFNTATRAITLTVTKRPVVLTANAMNVTYGTTPSYNPATATEPGMSFTPSNLASFDAGITLNANKYEIDLNNNGLYNQNPYYGTDAPGTGRMEWLRWNTDVGNYKYRLAGVTGLCASGTDIHTNYDFTYVAGNLNVVAKRLTATATAQDRAYNGSSTVDINYTITSGLVGDDLFAGLVIKNASQTATGTAASPNAMPTRQAVTLNDSVLMVYKLDGSVYTPFPNYFIEITDVSNRNTVDVLISKSNSVCVSPADFSLEYDASRILNSIALTNRAGNTPGTWTFSSSHAPDTTIPNAGSSTYSLIFTPTDTVNYNGGTGTVKMTITKKVVTVTSYASNSTIQYGDAAPAYGITFTGFSAPQNENNVAAQQGAAMLKEVFTVVCSYNSSSLPGNYTVEIRSIYGTSGDVTAQNYSFNIVQGNLAVSKRDLTITPVPLTLSYGALKPLSFELGGVGFVNGEGFANLTAASGLVYDTDYAQNSPQGTYWTSVSGYTSNKYNIIYINGILTVNKAVLHVKANNQAVQYGAAVPLYTVSITGFVGSDTQAVITSSNVNCAYVAWGVTNGSVGTYNIVPSGFTALNYDFTYENGTLTVTQADVTVTTWPTLHITYEDSLDMAVIDTAGVSQALTSSGPAAIPGSWYFDSSSTVPAFTDSNSTYYLFHFKPDNTNYKTVSTDLQIRIDKRQISGLLGISGTPMVSGQLFADISGMRPDLLSRYDFQWKISTDGGNTYNNISGANSSLLALDGSYENMYVGLTVTVKPNSPYIGDATTLGVLIYEYKTPVVIGDFTVTLNGKIYDRLPLTRPENVDILEKYAGIGDITAVKFNNSLLAPTAAGTYRVTFDVAMGESYGPAAGLYAGMITISQASVIVDVPVLDKTYDGTNNADLSGAISYSGVISGDTVNLNTGAITARFAQSDASASPVNVTISGAVLTGADAVNYKIVLSNTSKAMINKKALNAVATPVSREYNPSDYTVVVNFSGYQNDIIPADSATTTVSSGIGHLGFNNAALQTITSITGYTINGPKAGNYVLVISNPNPNVTIDKATRSLTPPAFAAYTYAGKRIGQDPYFALSDGWQWVNENEIPSVNKTSYALRNPGDANYKDIETTIPITILAKTLTIKTDGVVSILYGDAKPASFNINYEGFADGENASVLIGSLSFITDYYKGADANDYTISFASSLYNSNYNINYQTGILRVLRKPITTSLSAETRVYSPGVTAVTVTAAPLSGKISAYDDVSLNIFVFTGYTSSPNAGTGIDVSGFTLPYLIGQKASNYNLTVTYSNSNPAVTDKLQVTINKADPAPYSFPSSATLEYSYPLSSSTLPEDFVQTGAGTVVWENGGLVPPAVGSYPNQYSMKFVPTDINYNTVTHVVPVTVTVCDVNGKIFVSIQGTLNVGQTVSGVVSGANTEMMNNMDYAWYRVDSSGNEVLVGEESIYTLTTADQGNFIKLVVSVRGNYIGSAQGLTESIIAKIVLSFWQKLIAWINTLILAIQRFKI